MKNTIITLTSVIALTGAASAQVFNGATDIQLPNPATWGSDPAVVGFQAAGSYLTQDFTATVTAASASLLRQSQSSRFGFGASAAGSSGTMSVAFIGGTIPEYIGVDVLQKHSGVSQSLTLQGGATWDVANAELNGLALTFSNGNKTMNFTGSEQGIFGGLGIRSTGVVSGIDFITEGVGFNNSSVVSLFTSQNSVAVPEPSSTALLGLGALGLLIRRKR